MMRASCLFFLIPIFAACGMSESARPSATTSASASSNASLDVVTSDAASSASAAPVAPAVVVVSERESVVAAPREARETGPFETPFKGKRNVYYTIPKADKTTLIANIHGMCNPPGYACGYWTDTAKDYGFLVCPTGDGSCGPGAYNAPTWNEGEAAVDRDLEASIAVVDAAYPSEMNRDAAILTGFSRGGYLAPRIAEMHPGRWKYLIINEADVTLDADRLRKSGVRAVALIAGEYGGEVNGERATVKQLLAHHFPAKLFVMPKAGHFYSANIAEIMRDAIDFVQSNDPAAASDGGTAN